MVARGFDYGVLRGNMREFLCGDGTILCPDYGNSYLMNFMKL